METIKTCIETAYLHPDNLELPETRDAVNTTLQWLDEGKVRVAEPTAEGWIVHPWIRQAILCFFRLQKMQTWHAAPFEYHDKIPIKTGYKELGIRVVPPATARYGSYLERGVVLMPSYINIGAWVGAETMVDTWATVGSCAQVGRRVHLSGGVGVGGVLEPPQARPTIIEDGAFIGSRCVLVEGVHVEAQAVLGAGCVITGNSRIIDVSGPEPVEYRGRVPARSVVIPGSIPKSFPAGTFHIPCALIIGKRKESTDLKTSLNEVLREFALEV